MINRCATCGSTSVFNTKIELDHLGSKVKKVPATICQACGEEMVTSDVLEKVEQILAKGKTAYE